MDKNIGEIVWLNQPWIPQGCGMDSRNEFLNQVLLRR